jgi:hypothetical protein
MVGVDSHGPKDHDGAPSVGARLGLLLFFLFFFTMGSLFEVLLIRQFGQTIGQRFWKTTPCTILGSEIQERGENEEPFAFTVHYQYTYAGRSYTGSRYRRSDWTSGSYSETQRLVQKYPAGLSVFCYVDPQDPGQAVLRRDSLALGLVIPFPLIFVVIGAGGAFLIWRKPAPEAEKPIAAGAVRKSRKSKGKSRYAVPVLFALFALVGGALLYPLGIKPIAKTIAAEAWVATPCRVLRAEVRSHDSDDGTTYSVHILYQYEFQGQTYKSDRYEFLGGSSSGHEGKARVVEQYRAAANPVCYVNPDKPFEAVLKRGFHAKLLLVLLPLFFLLIGVGGLVPALRGKTPTNDQPLRPWTTRRPAGASYDLTRLRVTDSGRAVLTPRFSPKAKFIGMTILALFANVILSLFTWSPISSLLHGHPNWLGLLFVSPLIAIGIGLVGGAAYHGLAMFNPCPALELSSSTIPLGGAAELRWSFSGRTSRIDELTVTLRGIEQARYSKGTSTCTDRNTFHETELYRTSSPNEIASGQIGFIMPPDTMHSFEAENNKIFWRLDLHGSIKGWPDVKESFQITVTPAAD